MTKNLRDKHPGYFEGILQLRDCSPEVYDYVEKEINSIGLKIAKSVPIKNGIDYYTSDNSMTKGIGKKLQQRFGGNLIVTATLHTQKKDKELYRVTVMFREAGFKKNDLVRYNGDTYTVKLMGSSDIMLQHAKTGKKVHLRYREIDAIKKE